MNQEANANDASLNGSADAPFEWLTNFRSIRHLVLPSRIINRSLSSSPSKGDASESSNDGRDAVSPSSELQAVQLNALHVGCGTSTVGEFLLCLRERTHDRLLRYAHVVNVDNDKHALASMQRQWENRKPQNIDCSIGILDWKYLDFKSDESCRLAMDGVYRELVHSTTPLSEPGGCFDLVLDKSTLDCLLCAETSVVAQFLCEVYRALRIPSSIERNPSYDNSESSSSDALPASWGGVYVLITFHPADFVERLLTQLPGANWHVEHEVVRREVEDINKNWVWEVDEVNYDSKNSNTCMKKHMPCPSSSSWSSGTFDPDVNYRKTVNAFTCRRCCSQPGEIENASLPTCTLDPEKVRQHIERTCDEWYKTTNPMVTNKREEQIRKAFLEADVVTMKSKDRQRTGSGLPSPPSGDVLELKKCYDILFTNAEKEHLPYEYFLEDWSAYCERSCNCDDVTQVNQGGMTVTIALDFLREMQ